MHSYQVQRRRNSALLITAGDRYAQEEGHRDSEVNIHKSIDVPLLPVVLDHRRRQPVEQLQPVAPRVEPAVSEEASAEVSAEVSEEVSKQEACERGGERGDAYRNRSAALSWSSLTLCERVDVALWLSRSRSAACFCARFAGALRFAYSGSSFARRPRPPLADAGRRPWSRTRGPLARSSGPFK